MNILSIQSHVVFGHVGNSAAVFPLQRIGVEVWPIHTVQFSNHTGYGTWRGCTFEADLIRDVMQGLQERGVLGSCDGVLSGYIGSAEIGEAVLDAVGQVKRANPTAPYCCDPVIGDAGRDIFVAAGVAEFMRERVLPSAEIVTPNHFELDYVSGRGTRTMADVFGALDVIHAKGPQVIMVTSLHVADTPPDAIDILVSDRTGRFRVRTPKLPIVVNGAGDALTALFFAHYLRQGSASEAMALAVSSLFGVLRRTAQQGTGEMRIVSAQEEFIRPTQIFEAQRVTS